MPPREQDYCRSDRQGADEHRGAYPAYGGKSTAGECAQGFRATGYGSVQGW